MYQFQEKDIQVKMQKALDSLNYNVGSVRTGRASSNFLDSIKVESYGSMMSVKELATVSISGNDTLSVQAFDASTAPSIAKAIREASLGVNPIQEGSVIRIVLPKMTEERRKELVKLVEKYGEDSKVVVRNIRRNINDEIKAAEKNKEISKDDAKRFEDIVQKVTDNTMKSLELIVKNKGEEIMKV